MMQFRDALCVQSLIFIAATRRGSSPQWRSIPIFLKTYLAEKELRKREQEEQGMVEDVGIRVARFFQGIS
jgi:hypothetical protein